MKIIQPSTRFGLKPRGGGRLFAAFEHLLKRNSRLFFLTVPAEVNAMASSGFRSIIVLRAVLVVLFVTAGTASASGNDDFANRAVIAATPSATALPYDQLSREPGEPDHGVSFAGTLWAEWTAPDSGTHVIDTCGSNRLNTADGSDVTASTWMAVYTASVPDPGFADLTQVAHQSGEAGPFTRCAGSQSASIELATTEGTT
ncbi:MAG: hypothetical protein ACU843_07270 [Gammaproteobacteria bacterium]